MLYEDGERRLGEADSVIQSLMHHAYTESINRMQEALVLFDSICNSRWFVRTSIILFLNKIDLFREKITRSPIANFFPDYTGGTDLQAACDYFSSRFVGLNQSSAKQIYTHFTCATDVSRLPARRNVHVLKCRRLRRRIKSNSCSTPSTIL